MKYERAVEKAKELSKRAGDIKWELGDLALELEPKYGEATLERFSRDVEVEYNTLREYRRVSEAFPPQIARRLANWSVHQVLSSHPDLHDQMNEKMTMRQAKKLVSSEGEWQEAMKELSGAIDTIHTCLSFFLKEEDDLKEGEELAVDPDLLTEDRLTEISSSHGPFINALAEWFLVAEGGDVDKAQDNLEEFLLELQGEDEA